MFQRLWAIMYFRELSCQLSDVDDWFIEYFFKFATTYTEDSILQARVKERVKKDKKMSQDQMRDLGYTEEDIAKMDLK